MSAIHPAVSLILLSGLAIYWLIPLTAWFILRGRNDTLSNLWFGGATLFAVSVSGFVFTRYLPVSGLTLATDAISTSAVLFFAEALRRETSTRPWPRRLYLGLVLGEMGLQSLLAQAGLSIEWRTALHILLLAMLDLWIALSAARIALQRSSRALWIVVFVFACIGALNLARFVEMGLTGHFTRLLDFTPFSNLTLMLNYLAGIFYCYGYWGFVLEKSQCHLVLATEASAIAKERERMTERIATISKMAQSSAVSAAIAHEINQPLAAMRLDVEHAQILARQIDPDHPLQTPLRRIERDVQRVAQIIQRLREMFVSSGRVESTAQADEVIGNAVGLLQAQLQQSDIRVMLHLQAHRNASMDASELEHILLNLMHNAMEAFALANTEEPTLDVRTWVEHDCFFLSCTDNGPGIPSELQETIFEMQFSTKKHNMGLGLWLSRYIAERHGGKLWLDASWPIGSRFILRMPAA